MNILLKCGSERVISMEKTGKRLGHLMRQGSYSVKDIQKLLDLACPQPVYRWLQGKALPTVDHLYILSGLFQIHMEELLVPECEVLKAVIREHGEPEERERRFRMYGKCMRPHSRGERKELGLSVQQQPTLEEGMAIWQTGQRQDSYMTGSPGLQDRIPPDEGDILYSRGQCGK